MNRALLTLTVIFALTIPVSIISSVYGVNINLPGGIETGSLTLPGSYTTLYVIIAVSLIPAIVMLLYFRKLELDRLKVEFRHHHLSMVEK